MTRILVVHHDPDQADIEVDRLRRAGHEVQQCAGPLANSCPLLQGAVCRQVEWAELLVYDAWISGDGEPELIERLQAVHPEKAMMLMSGGLAPGHHRSPQRAPRPVPAW
jgi:DNA-binding NtrC family response regulator